MLYVIVCIHRRSKPTGSRQLFGHHKFRFCKNSFTKFRLTFSTKSEFWVNKMVVVLRFTLRSTNSSSDVIIYISNHCFYSQHAQLKVALCFSTTRSLKLIYQNVTHPRATHMFTKHKTVSHNIKLSGVACSFNGSMLLKINL